MANLTWGDFRTQIRRSILKDTGVTPKWDNDTLRDCVWWALDAFCAYHAVATATEFETDETTVQFTLPGNVYGNLEDEGVVYLEMTRGQKFYYPSWKTPGKTMNSTDGFFVWPSNKLNLVAPPAEGGTLNVLYYAQYNRPYSDNDLITVPDWAQAPVAYLVGIEAITRNALQEAVTSMGDNNKDSGNPEHNAIAAQQERWLRLYEWFLKQHPRQTRINSSMSLERR